MSDQIAMLNGLGGRGGRKGRKWQRGLHRSKGRRGPGAEKEWDADDYREHFDAQHWTPYARKSRIPGRGWGGLGAVQYDYIDGLGADGGMGISGTTIVVLGALAIGAFIIIKKMGENAEGTSTTAAE